MPAKQTEFEFIPPKPTKARLRRAHMIDAGQGQGDHPYGAQFRCRACQWESGWWRFEKVAEIKRGVPCPNCNHPDERSDLPTLILPLKANYFQQIKLGSKKEEYRLENPYWQRRLEGKELGEIILTSGYPKREDNARRIRRPWAGFHKTTITHEHFGPNPVSVFAIIVN